MRATVASAARLKPYGDDEHTWDAAAGSTYGGEEGIAGQVRKVGAETVAIGSGDSLSVDGRVRRELVSALRWWW